MGHAAFLDHLILPTRDLDAAERSFKRLGFSLSPRKSYPFGDARIENHLIYMNGSYIELLALTEGDVPFLRSVLEKRAGLAGLALRSDAPESRRERARNLGFDVQCQEFDVNFTVDGKTFEGEFRASLFLDDRYPVSWMQLIEETIPYDRSPFFVPHANTTDRLQKLVIVADDLEKVTAIHDVVMDASLTEARMPIEWNDGVASYVVMQPDDFGEIYGETTLSDPALQPCFAAIHLLVDDLAATRTILKENGADFSEKNDSLVISSENADGLTLVFEQ